MRRIVVLSFLLLLLSVTALSQRLYFIYFQTESQQPFFIKINEKLYSSTSTGYLIMPRLKDSTYNITLGFAGNQFPEQKFSCTISKKDHGYLVKNFGDKGWGLIDLQTQSVQMAESNGKKDVSLVNSPVNAFTDLLARAADDSTLKQKIVLPDEKKPEPVVQAPAPKEVPKDSVSVATGTVKPGNAVPANAVVETVKKEEKKETGAAADSISNSRSLAQAKQPAPVINKETNKTTDTTGKVTTAKKETDKDIAAVTGNGQGVKSPAKSNQPAEGLKKETDKSTDTSARTVPVKKSEISSGVAEVKMDKADTGLQKEAKLQNPVSSEPQPQSPVFAKSKVTRTAGVSTTEGFDLIYTDTYADGRQDVIRILIPEENKTAFSNPPAPDTAQKKAGGAAVTSLPVAPDNSTKAVTGNNCRLVASDADFYKLRKKMAAGKSDAAMLEEANRVFRTKCFTSSQIKNLGSLFLGDGGKYSFYDAAYPHVADMENFPALQSELKDEYFINRFKAMLR
jgi:hypothetical protein